MAITRAIGKNTLGDNKKMKVRMHEYEMSTHDLSFIWRNTQAPGTLVPCLKLIAQKGDIFDIEMFNKTLTHPTVGPLFGSYKLQHFIFTCPIRLYNSWLHNNRTGIGMKMGDIKIPKLELNTNFSQYWKNECNPSSLLAYLGFKGARSTNTATTTRVNAIPVLAYYDIFKNYFANTQEPKAWFVSGVTKMVNAWLISNGTTPKTIINNGTTPVEVNITVNESTNIGGGIKAAGLTWQQVWENTELVISTNGDSKRYSVSELSNNISTELVTLNLLPVAGHKVLKSIRDINLIGNTGVSLTSFPLENIDKMRDYILSTPGNTTAIPGTSKNEAANLVPYNQIMKTNTDDMPEFGLMIKTYDSDIFQNWVNTDWIDGSNGISEITAVDVSGGTLTMDSLNLAQKVYNMLNRIAISGGTYRDWLETVFTSGKYLERPETPIFEGGMTQWIEFEEVVSNAATENEPLGTLAGRGKTTQQRGSGKLHFRVHEPSYIIGICAITPQIDYSQGNDWDMTQLQTMNDLHKPALDGIGYQDSMNSERHWRTANFTSPYQDTAAGKTVAWINYMTNFNKTFGNFASGKSESFMVLNRNYEINTNTNSIDDLTTYIDPGKYNNIFADTSIDAMNFWLQTAFNIRVRRNISAKQIPNL